MSETANRMWTQLREYFAKMPRKNKVQLAILSVIVVALAIAAVAVLNRQSYVLVYSTYDYEDNLRASMAIRDMGIDVSLDFPNIMVPENNRDEARQELIRLGLIGNLGFDREDYMGQAVGFNITSDHSKILYDMQLSDDIRTYILQSPRIQNATVIATRGETSPFRLSNNARQASAAVSLTLRGGGRLTNSEAQAIGEIVRNTIPGISYDNITVTDSDLNYYRIGEDLEPSLNEELEYRLALRNKMTAQFREQVDQLLWPIFRSENFEVSVTLELNFDRVVTETVKFEPSVPGELQGMIRSDSKLWEAYRRGDLAEGIPGTDPNGMGTVEYPFGPLGDDGLYWKHIDERNFDINETRRLIEHEQGNITRLSVGVTLNRRLSEEDFADDLRLLIATTLGIAPANVAVYYFPFFDTTDELREAVEARERYEEQLRQQRLIELIMQWSVILLLGICFMILVRKIFVTIKPPPEPEPVLVGVGPVGIDYIVDDDDEEEEVIYEDLDLQQKSAGLEQIEKFIDKDAAAVAQLLRNWLSEE